MCENCSWLYADEVAAPDELAWGQPNSIALDDLFREGLG